ncbi:MAG TPA: ATPase, T2SS/T4P/T4SS family [Candidatus Polarisedimenticolia bacterium]|nr:ATPase, T2SS/T4P/T4SS family [Candidatus Polarisedimenticolia bacterium]
MPREYATQCWSCLGEFDAATAIWCACSAKSATKLCPFCFHCFCQADAEYRETFWRNAPSDLKEERDLLKGAAGSSGEALIRSNLLSTDQLVAALRWRQNRGGALEDALVDLGFVSRENLELIVKRQVPDSATTMDLSKGLVDASLVKIVTVELCFRKKILPISKEVIGEKSILTLAMAGPTDVETIDQVQSLTDCRVIPMNASETDILNRLQALFPNEVAALTAGEGRENTPAPSAANRPTRRAAARTAAASAPRPRSGRRGSAKPTPREIEELEEILDAVPTPDPAAVPVAAPAVFPDADPLALPRAPAPVPPEPAAVPQPQAAVDEGGLLQAILADAISKRTSHLQFEIRGPSLSLFLRIDGNLFRAKVPASASAAGIERALNSVSGLPANDHPAAGHLAVRSGERKIEVVVRRFHSPGAVSFLLKIIERTDFLRPLGDLGPSAFDLDRIRQALALQRGLLLLSAPPHNGLETTRYSLMSHLATERRRVLSIDAPQLVGIEGIRQEEVGFPADAARCRAAVTAIPGSEVVFLPEVQTAEMASLAVELAGSALVVAGIQARRASQAPAALLWHQVDPTTLSSRLMLILNQRLVRRICRSCRTTSPVTDRVLKLMGLSPDEALDLKVSQGAGCDACGPLSPGYAGRVALCEILQVTPEIAALVAAGGSPGEIEREARRAGMSPLRAACLAHVGQGVTTLEEFQKGNF